MFPMARSMRPKLLRHFAVFVPCFAPPIQMLNFVTFVRALGPRRGRVKGVRALFPERCSVDQSSRYCPPLGAGAILGT